MLTGPRFLNLQLVLLIGVAGCLFFSFLGLRDIWDIDEGMHAAMAQTMVLSGDWITPYIDGEPFFDKPVLFNWLNAIAFVLFGFTETAARLPAAITGLGCVILTWQLARKLYGDRVGFLSGLVLATSLEFLILSRVVQYDIPFTFFTTLALWSFANAVIDEKRRRGYFLLFYVGAALAVLTKGPLGLFLPGMVIGFYLLATRQLKLISQMQIIPGILIFFAIVAPWFVMMERANEGYLNYFIVKQHFGNFLGGEGTMKPRHPEPFYYYIPVLLAGLLPWSALLPQSIVRAYKSDRMADHGMSLFFVIWIISMLAFFSTATSKLSTYMLPLFPAIAILIGRYVVSFLDEPSDESRRGVLIGVGCWLLPIALLAAYAIPMDPWLYWNHRAGIIWAEFEMFLALFTTLLIVTFSLVYFRKNKAAITAFAVTTPALMFYIVLVLVPDVNPFKGAKEIGLQIDYLLDDRQKIPMYGQFQDSTLFYTGRESRMIHTEEDLTRFLDSSNRRYVLIRDRSRKESDAFKGDYHIVLRVGNKAIVSNQPSTLLDQDGD